MIALRYFTLICLVGLWVCANSAYAQKQVDLDAEVAKTDIASLPYPVEEIVVRGFDGDNPPPRLTAPDRPLFYGYGMTAYYKSQDSLIFFNIVKLNAVHIDKSGETIKSFELKGNRYPDPFKNYFVSKIPREQWSDIYFRDIYLKDKKGNYLKIEEEQRFCPHCP